LPSGRRGKTHVAAQAPGRIVPGRAHCRFETLWPTYILLGLGKADASLTLFHIGGAFGIDSG
jgi:hypothetical protein